MREIKQNILPQIKKYERAKDYDYWEKHPSKKALKKLKEPTYQLKSASVEDITTIDTQEVNG